MSSVSFTLSMLDVANKRLHNAIITATRNEQISASTGNYLLWETTKRSAALAACLFNTVISIVTIPGFVYETIVISNKIASESHGMRSAARAWAAFAKACGVANFAPLIAVIAPTTVYESWQAREKAIQLEAECLAQLPRVVPSTVANLGAAQPASDTELRQQLAAELVQDFPLNKPGSPRVTLASIDTTILNPAVERIKAQFTPLDRVQGLFWYPCSTHFELHYASSSADRADARLLFDLLRTAKRELVERGIYPADEIEQMCGSSYFSMLNIALLEFVSHIWFHANTYYPQFAHPMMPSHASLGALQWIFDCNVIVTDLVPNDATYKPQDLEGDLRPLSENCRALSPSNLKVLKGYLAHNEEIDIHETAPQIERLYKDINKLREDWLQPFLMRAQESFHGAPLTLKTVFEEPT